MKNELKSLVADLKSHIKTLDEDDCLPAGAALHKTSPKSKEIESVLDEVKKCRKCRLGLSRLNPVFGVGSLNAKAMFIGEGPGYEEDHKGEPFVGKAGQLLDRILAAIGLSRKTVYIANIVKCHPMVNPEAPEARGNDRQPLPEEISACRPYLDEQIRVIKPVCIVALGAVSARALLGRNDGISALRGKWYDYPCDIFGQAETIKLLPTYHPAAILRNPSLKKDAWTDMKMLKAFLEKNR
ncbi:MAG: uracil-DNA glycosylase [Elusimicrobia bacterium]|nr:uracil-DNA glycosylase [Elusimicrobiota bacterium]